jgi:exosortase
MAVTLQQNGQHVKTRKALSTTLDLPTAGLLIAAVALLLATAKPILTWWAWEWTKPESYYAHAPVIPFLTLLMLWHRRTALRAIPTAPTAWALTALVPSLMLLVLSVKMELEAVESTALLLAITSAVWLMMGTRWLRAALFPLAFLWLMAPLPGPVLNDATLHLQMTSTRLANSLLHLLQFHTTLTGNVIQMDDFSLFVDVPCSGFKLLLSLLTVSAALAYLLDGPAQRRVGLFLLSLPLSLVVNSVRIALIGIVGECLGATSAHTFHDWSGVLTLSLGVAALFGVAKGLGCRTFAGWPLF